MLGPIGLYTRMSTHTDHIVRLASIIGDHEGVSHWAISMRITGRGDRIERLLNGGDVLTGTYETIICNFAAVWPADLAWPADIPRPSRSKDAA